MKVLPVDFSVLLKKAVVAPIPITAIAAIVVKLIIIFLVHILSYPLFCARWQKGGGLFVLVNSTL